MLLLLLCLPYSAYSDSISGISNNAASDGNTWDMKKYLPPETGLIINQIFYKYTVNKIREDDFSVTIANKKAGGTGNIFESTDDWSDVSGQTIEKILPVANIPREFWGDGSISTTGNGQVIDPNVRYSYIFDDCINPLSNPLCPQAIDTVKLPLIENPFDSDIVKNSLAKEVDIDEDDERKDEDNELEDDDKRRNLSKSANPLLADAARLAALFDQMAQSPKFDSYYVIQLDGKTYEDNVSLKDSDLPDNRRALKSLARDDKFNTIVRSQYER